MTATMTKETTEQELRTQIAALDRKITSQAKHIAKLERELADKRTERAHLIRQRIDLLQRELPEMDEPNTPRTFKGQQEYLAKKQQENTNG